MLSWSLPLSKQSRAGHRGPRSGPLLTALSSSHPLGLGPRRALGSRRAQGPRRPRDEGRGQQSPPPRDSHGGRPRRGVAAVAASARRPPPGYRGLVPPTPEQGRGRAAETARLRVCPSEQTVTPTDKDTKQPGIKTTSVLICGGERGADGKWVARGSLVFARNHCHTPSAPSRRPPVGRALPAPTLLVRLPLPRPLHALALASSDWAAAPGL